MIGIVLYGQLGNQMFQYAAAKYLANKLGVGVQCFGPKSSWRSKIFAISGARLAEQHPDAGVHNGLLNKAFGYGPGKVSLHLNGQCRTVLDKCLFQRSYTPETEVTATEAFIEHYDHDFQSLPDRTLLSGWFQSAKYWNNDHSFARQLYRSGDNVIALQNAIETDLGTALEDTIGLHVRRADYLQMRHGLSHSESGWVLPISYYTEALAALDPSRKVLVFSDDPAWAESHFLGDRFVVQPRRSAATDLLLLSMCGDKVIANSSFSWWAAYLGETEDRSIIAPAYHLGWRVSRWVPNDIKMPNWRYLRVDTSQNPAHEGQLL